MLYLLLPLSPLSSRCVSLLSACRRHFQAPSRRRRSKARSRSSRSGRWRARRSSSSSAPTAAASSTPTRRIRSRTPTPGPTSSRSGRSCLIPVASVIAFGRAVGDMRQGRAILATMGVFLIVGVGIVYWSETPAIRSYRARGRPVGRAISRARRFGSARRCRPCSPSATTGTGTGAVTTMHDSLTPLGGLVPMFDILAGCIWPGGVGAGLYGFLVVAVIAVFVAGLMVGRTPEYLGKKIEVREMKLAMLAVLIYPLVVLGFSGASVLLQTALDSLGNSGPHGLSEIVYAYASTNANNGSAFAGLNGNTLWFNSTLGTAMLLGRFAYVVPVLALAGSLAAKKKIPAVGGDVPDRRAAVRRPVGWGDRHSLPPAIFPRPVARAGRRALPDAQRQDVLIGDRPMASKTKSQGLFDGKIIARRGDRRLAQARPAGPGEEPGHLRHRGGVADGDAVLHSRSGDRQRLGDVFRPDRGLALVHGAVCEFRRGSRRGARQGAGRRLAPHAQRHPRQALHRSRKPQRSSSKG